MMGDLSDDIYKGIIPRAAEAIFQKIESSDANVEFKISCSYLEIYNESIQDLLDTSKKNLKVHESPSKGIYVDDLTEYYVTSAEEIYQYLDLGANNRVVACTNMNAVSSRSHSVFIIRVTQTDRSSGTVKNGSLNLVDLAGSEKVGKTGASGQTLEEAKKINQSLSALGQCINALVENKPHVPFRNSKLTRILQQSLGGNSKTTMICACSPSPFNAEETISTIKFGQRAKTIKCKVKLNQVRSAKELERIIENLKAQINKLKLSNKRYRQLLSEYRKREGLPELTSDDDESAAKEAESDTVDANGDADDEVNNPALQQDDVEADASLNIAELQLQYEELKAKYDDDTLQLGEDLETVAEEKARLEKEVKELEKMCEENELSLEELLEELDVATAEKENMEKKMQFQREETDIELEELLNTIDELERDKKDLSQRVADLAGEVPPSENEDEEVSEIESTGSTAAFGDPVQRGKILAELEQLRAMTQHQQGLIDRHGDNVSMVQGDLEEAVVQKSFVEEELQKLKTKSSQDNQKLTQQVQSMKREKYDLDKRVSALQDDLINAEGETKKLDKSYTLETKKTSRFLKDISSLREEIKNQNAQILELKVKAVNKLGDAEEVILEQYTQQMRELQDASERMTKSNEAVATELQAEVAELTKRLHIAERKAAFANRANSATADHSLEELLQEELTETQTTLAEIQVKATEQTKQLHDAQTELSVERAKNKARDDDKEAIKRDYDIRLSHLQAENESLIVEREQLKQQLDLAGGSDGGSGSHSYRGSFGRMVNELFELRSKFKKADYERKKLLEESNHQRKVILSERNKLKNSNKRITLQTDRIKNLDEELQRSLTKESITKELREKFKQRENQYTERIRALEAALDAAQKSAALQKKHSNVYKPMSRG